ncbi:hypothetical protein QTP86_009395 [Hemibagrus guttatus]|nr:hypothetical protein QTP86_009395 [Hemibagrus guttatus]
MKVSRSKTEYMCVNEREGGGTVRLQGEEVKKVQEFKYLGSTVQSNGECGKEVKKRVQGKVYRTVVRAAMLYGLETVSLRKRQESELEVAELKMLRFSLGVTRLDRIRNEYIRGTAHVGRLGDKVREARLRWFGHVQRRDSEYIGRRMLDMELPGRRQRGRPKRSALNPICYHLVPLLFTSGTFAAVPRISLHLLDVDATKDSLSALKMEVEDMALPQLHQVTVHSDLNQAFQSADLIVLLDDGEPNEEPEQRLSRVVERFYQYGRLIEDNAHKDLRVLVAGDVFVNLKCGLLIENVPSVDPRRFVAMATQLEGEARTQLALQLSVKSQDITDVIVWGNISGSFHIDLQQAKVYRYKGAIWGPEGFSQNVLEMVYDRKWLKNELQSLVSSRRCAISLKTNRTAAISASRGIITALDAWINDYYSPQTFSLGVVSTGHFGIPSGLVFCVPVTFQKGEWSVCSDIVITEKLQRKLETAVNEVKAYSALSLRRNSIIPYVYMYWKTSCQSAVLTSAQTSVMARSRLNKTTATGDRETSVCGTHLRYK